jgi:hypothetical protein
LAAAIAEQLRSTRHQCTSLIYTISIYYGTR